MSLLDDLKAAHEAATPGPWSGPLPLVRVGKRLRHQTFTGELRENPEADESLIVLTCNALPEIIAALEERERLRAVVEAAQRVVVERGHTDPGLDDADITQLRATLDALEKKG